MFSDCETADLFRIYNKIWKRCYRDFCGAFDWPTLRVVFPQRAEALRGIVAELKGRGEFHA